MPRRKSCSSPRAATPPSGLATNTSPCQFPSRGLRFLPFETAASMRLRLTATFRAPARASPPASKPSPNFSSPRSKFPARPKPPFCPSPLAQAPPAPPRFSPSPRAFSFGHPFQWPVDNSRFIYKSLICKGEPYDWNRNQTRYRGTRGSQRSRTRPSPRLRNGAPHRAANQRRAALHARGPVPHALPHGAARLDSRRMGNQRQRPKAPLLPPHACREEETVTSAEGMGGTVRRTEAADQGVACLIGKDLSAGASPASL